MPKIPIALMSALAAVSAGAAAGLITGGLAAGVLLVAVLGTLGFAGMRARRDRGAA